MKCRLFGVAVLVALGGCAQSGPHPSYLGVPELAGDEASAAESTDSKPSESLRRIQSNKILGAMAFQKVTGRTVDPESLAGRE